MKKVLVCLATSLILLSCTSQKSPVAESDSITAVTAWEKIHEMLIKQWQPDSELIQIGNVSSNKLLSLDGKARGWDAQVISPSKKLIATFGYTIDIKGVERFGAEKPYKDNASLPYPPIPLEQWKIDSDRAYSAAQEAGGTTAQRAEHKGTLDAKYVLHWSPEFKTPVWEIVYGKRSNPLFEATIDSQSGKVLSASPKK